MKTTASPGLIRNGSFAAILVANVVLLLAGPAPASTTYTWTGAAGGATWDTTATNWSGGTTPWDGINGPNDIASIAGGIINVSGNVYASGILFTGGTTTINDAGSGATITLSSSTLGIYGNGNSNYLATINVPIILGAGAVALDTTGGGGGGSLTLAGGITGTSNLTLGLANNNNGAHPLMISGLGVNNNGSITNVNSAGGSNTTISGPIGALVTNVTQSGTYPLILSGTNSSYAGTFTVTQGTLQFNSSAAIGGSGQNVTVNANGAVVLNGASDLSPLIARIATSSTGAIALNTNSSLNFDFGAAGLTAASLGASGNVTYSGSLTPEGGTYRLGGSVGTLTLTTNALGGGNSLAVNGTSAGASTVVLAVANTYTGTTTLNGGTLTLNVAETPGTSGPLGVPSVPSGSIIFNGGTLQHSSVNNYDYSARFSTDANQKCSVNTNGRDVIWDTNLISAGGSLTKSGSGKLTLNGTNTYTGVTTLTGGTLSVATIGDGGVAGNLGQAPAAATNLVLGTGTLQYTGSTASINRGITVSLDQRATFEIPNAATTLTLSGGITSGSGTTSYMSKTGPGTLVLSGASVRRVDGSANSQVDAGTLQFATQVALENNQPARWTAAKMPVASGATVAFNVGGTGQFTPGNVTTLLNNLLGVTVALNNNGLKAGSLIGFDTTNAAGGTFTIADSIANSAGTGAGAVGVTKLGSNTLVLGGTNTYTGPTTISGGTLALTGSLASATSVSIAAGATFDVTALTTSAATYVWNTAALKASGTGAGAAASVTGTAGGAISLGSTPMTLIWAGNPSGIDSAHPPLTVAGADLSLGGNPFTVVTGTALGAGTYTLVSAASISGGSTVNGTPLFTGGAGLLSGTTGVVSISSNTVILTVTSLSADPFTTWITGLDWSGFVSPDLTATGDPDHDGMTNQQEYAFGLDPRLGSSVRPITSAPDRTTGQFTYTRRKPLLTGLSYTYQYSATLSGAWSPFAAASEASNGGDPIESITVGIPGSVRLANPTLFVRVKAE